MTFLARDASVLEDTAESTSIPAFSSTAQDSALPRFHLRKRTVCGDRETMKLATVNSAFLSGLFADLSQAQDSNSSNLSSDCQEDADVLSRLDQTLPLKKSRVAMSRSISRCAKSFKSLGDALRCSATSEILAGSTPATPSNHMEKEDSLLFQLNCVSSETCSGANLPNSSIDVAKLAFPHLPASVSNSSCSTLTRKPSDPQSSSAENTQKDSYGWFVEMDDDDVNSEVRLTDAYPTSSSCSDLAFVAPTAPKASSYDDELEWAKAADTVDDVLGDFF